MQDSNYSLFDEEAFKDVPRSSSATLAVRKGNRKKLSKAQNDFNRLSKRIVVIQRQLEERRAQYDELLAAWSVQVPELDTTYAQQQLRVALQLDKAGLRFKFGSVQILKLRFTIMTLIREAFGVIEPTPEGEAAFQRWNGKELRNVVQEEFDVVKSVLEKGFRENFGMDFDLGDLDMSEESFARLSAEFEARLGEGWADPRRAARTAREMQAEMAAKLDAERVKRSIRTVYLNIAKSLHPDTTLDEEERQRRDDVMKIVTVAYENNDLQTLLRVEMIEMERGCDRINHLPDETLALYNASLKEQVKDLESELYELRNHPRYTPIAYLLNTHPDYLGGKLQREIEKQMELIGRWDLWIAILTDHAAKEDVMSVLNKFCTDYDEEFADWSGRPSKRPVYSFWPY